MQKKKISIFCIYFSQAFKIHKANWVDNKEGINFYTFSITLNPTLTTRSSNMRARTLSMLKAKAQEMSLMCTIHCTIEKIFKDFLTDL